MGGDHAGHGHGGGDFRQKVWSMTGGPYCRPVHWRRNTAIAMFGIFLICIPIAMKSAELEQRPHHPVRPGRVSPAFEGSDFGSLPRGPRGSWGPRGSDPKSLPSKAGDLNSSGPSRLNFGAKTLVRRSIEGYCN